MDFNTVLLQLKQLKEQNAALKKVKQAELEH